MKHVNLNDEQAVKKLLQRFKREQLTAQQAMEALGIDEEAFDALRERHRIGYHLKDLLHDTKDLGVVS